MNKDILMLILKAIQTILQTSITPKEIPSDKYLSAKSWEKIDKKRREYVNAMINEIDLLTTGKKE